jgi:ABC-type bacteriocin/lantibiotic exporter with double-glycine peptidase domain
MEKFITLLSKDNKKDVIYFIILNIILIFFETFGIALIPLAIDFVISDNPLLPKYLGPMSDLLINIDKKDLLLYMAIFIAFLFLVKNLYILGLIYYQETLSVKFRSELKKKFFSYYLNAPFELINSYSSSQVLRNTDDETSSYVTNFFLILKSFKDFFLFLLIFILLLIVDFTITLITVTFLLSILILYFFLFHKKLKKIGEERLHAKNLLIKWILQSLNSLKDIKISKKEDKVLQKFTSKVGIFENSRRKINFIGAIPASAFEFIFVVIVFTLIIFISNTEVENILPILSLYIISFIRMLPIFAKFGQVLSSLRSSFPSVLHLNSELQKFEKFQNLEKKIFDKTIKIKFEKNLNIENITFQYLNGDKKIFHNLNLSIEKGKAIGFVGKSGSGKTTLINIISGLLSPSKGQITADGVDIFKNIDSWHKKIGLVPQDNFLLDDTILKNIVFLNDENKVDEKRLKDAIYYSALSEFINELELGVNTNVGEGGALLSGGQIQRVILARLLYNDPQILILDEFTNSLDPESENHVLEKLNLLKKEKNKNFFIISHKIKPLKLCDEIIVLENGKILKKYNYSEFYEKFNFLYD